MAQFECSTCAELCRQNSSRLLLGYRIQKGPGTEGLLAAQPCSSWALANAALKSRSPIFKQGDRYPANYSSCCRSFLAQLILC